MSANLPDQWLIRTAENKILGPYSRAQICQLIQQGKLQLNDEVCQANTYWFYLHEDQEIKKQLGIELPKQLYPTPEESTQTETDTQIDTPESVPELSQSLDEIGENTAVMSNRAFRDFRHGKKPDPQPVASASPVPLAVHGIPERRVRVERSRVVQWVTYAMMMGALALLVAVIKLLREQPGG